MTWAEPRLGLHAMPGKERQRHVGGLRPARERGHLALHVGAREIHTEIDVEVELSQCLREITGVVRRVFQGIQVLVRAVADDESHPGFGMGRGGRTSSISDTRTGAISRPQSTSLGVHSKSGFKTVLLAQNQTGADTTSRCRSLSRSQSSKRRGCLLTMKPWSLSIWT
jgi:hypothetical protein